MLYKKKKKNFELFFREYWKFVKKDENIIKVVNIKY